MNTWRNKLLWNASPDEFASGDKICVTQLALDGSFGLFEGEVGTIVSKERNGFWLVEFANGYQYSLSERNIAPLENNKNRNRTADWRNNLLWQSLITREEAPSLLNKRVLVNSYKIKGKTGIIKQYISNTHHFWVYMDEPYETKSGKLSRWHKCNAGNCKLVDNNKLLWNTNIPSRKRIRYIGPPTSYVNNIIDIDTGFKGTVVDQDRSFYYVEWDNLPLIKEMYPNNILNSKGWAIRKSLVEEIDE
jgi:hypothetical protein